jgi:hypothetical protein
MLFLHFIIIILCHYTVIGEGGSDCCFNAQYSNGSSCIPCKAGADCSIVGTNIATQVLQAGYWRASTNSTDIRKCWLPAACNRTATTNTTTTAIATTAVLSTVGGSSSSSSSAAIISALTVTDPYCTTGYKGPCK